MPKNIILTINIVEPGLVRAVKRHSERLGYELQGLVLVNKEYITQDDRPRDETGLFKEVVCDFDDPNELQATLKPYEDDILAVTCRYESAIEPFRKVIPFLPYIHKPTETALLWATDKHLMRDRLRIHDPKLVPKYVHLQAYSQTILKELTTELRFPVIVKPSDLASALLVTRCDNEQELDVCLNHTFQVIKDIYKRQHRSRPPSVLVEEIIQGDMYSTDAYVSSTGEVYCLPLVKVITAESLGLPGFYSYRHIIPVDLPDDEIQRAFGATTSATKALHLSSTTTHVELFLSPEGWKIIEVGARIGGYREDLYREAYGIDHYYNDLAIRMGMEPEISMKPLRHAAGLNIYAGEEGVIEEIKGLETARELPSIVHLTPHAKKGDMALFASNGGELLVDGILSNEDAEQLEHDVAELRRLVRIQVKTD